MIIYGNRTSDAMWSIVIKTNCRNFSIRTFRLSLCYKKIAQFSRSTGLHVVFIWREIYKWETVFLVIVDVWCRKSPSFYTRLLPKSDDLSISWQTFLGLITWYPGWLQLLIHSLFGAKILCYVFVKLNLKSMNGYKTVRCLFAWQMLNAIHRKRQ